MSDDRQRAASKAEARAAIDAASRELASGDIVDVEWQRRVSNALASAYLREDDPRWQSGFDGDAKLWREARELVLDAVAAHGSFLDVGCANGHLMECLVTWASERGSEITVHGLEINPDLATAARRRLPAWSDRIHTGNISDWIPPHRFTYIRTGLEYVPPGRGRESLLIARVLRDLVEPGGRLIVGPVPEHDVAKTVAAFTSAGVASPVVASRTDRNGKTRYIVWTEAEQRE